MATTDALWLRTMQRETGLSQVAFARRLGITAGDFSRYVRGRVKVPPPVMRLAILIRQQIGNRNPSGEAVDKRGRPVDA